MRPLLIISAGIWLELRTASCLSWNIKVWEEYWSEGGENWCVLGWSHGDYFVNEVMTVCCSAPEGQISLFSWDLDQFNQSVMILKNVSGCVQRCLSKRRRSAVYGSSTLFRVHLRTFWDIIVKYCTYCLSPQLLLHPPPQVYFLVHLFPKKYLFILSVL